MITHLLYQLHNIQHRYNDRLVLDLPALEIQRGEILSIVGPSGSGKSTLLRLLQFLEMPSAGTILFDSQRIESKPPLKLRRQVATVFQRPMLLDRSVRDNVAFGLQLRRAQAIDRVVSQALDRVGLLKVAHDKARTLSGGESQRVALARAIVLQPDALLLDEPTANLDPYNVSLIENLIRDHDRMTIVLVTHNIFQAKRLADRVGLLINGQLIELAAADQFFNSPIDLRTRAFINGEMVY